ncbi:MAG: hypothetical protein ABH806_00725 [Candidatus Omnitrophota bacterium]
MDYKGAIKTFDIKNIKFGYRRSSLSKYIILSALLRLKKGSKKESGDKIREYLRCRMLTHDLSMPSAGCVFRNPPGHSAGKLIDLCGLKGKRLKDAAVSLKHANFILNLGHASSADVMRLMAFIKKKVDNRFRIKLVPEIRIWQG